MQENKRIDYKTILTFIGFAVCCFGISILSNCDPTPLKYQESLYQQKIDSIVSSKNKVIDSLKSHRDSVYIEKIKTITRIKHVRIDDVVEKSKDNFLAVTDSSKISVVDSLVCVDTLTYRNSVIQNEETELRLFESNENLKICQEEKKLISDTSSVRITESKQTIQNQNEEINSKNKKLGFYKTVAIVTTTATVILASIFSLTSF